MRRLAFGLIVLSFSRGALSATSPPADLNKLPATAFDSLPDSALVEFEGKKMTKARFIAEMGALRSRMTALKPPGGRNPSPPDFSAVRMKLLDKEKARLEGKNARVGSVSPDIGAAGLAPTPTPDPCTKPKITALSAAPPLEPGEQVILNGCGFGLKDPGSELRFVGNFPGGFLKLQILQWHGNAIKAVVPPVSGVKDQPSKLQVVRKDLQLSNEWPVTFRATRDVTKLSLADVKQTCSTGDYLDDCAPKTFTLRGLHGSPTAYKSGTDTVSGNLKNGCVLAGLGWGWHGSNGTLTADPTTTLVNGSAGINMSIPWVHWSDGIVEYTMDLWALGPVGVPCH